MARFESHDRWAVEVTGPRGTIECKRFSTHKAAMNWLADMCGYAAAVNAMGYRDDYGFAAKQFGRKSRARARTLKVGDLSYSVRCLV